LCNHPKGSVTWRGRWLINCLVCASGYDTSGQYLTALARALGTDGGRLLSDPLAYLGRHLLDGAAGGGGRSGRRKPAPLPSADVLRGWQRALLGSPSLLRSLRLRRGLSEESVRRWRLGWDEAHQGFTLPIFDDHGVLVNVTWRAGKGALLRGFGERKKVHRLAGRRAADGCLPLYPDIPDGSLLLVEGEFDALIARQHGLPAITGLLGAQWVGAWDAAVRGRRVAVAYDTGAERAALKTVTKLRDAGARAWVVALGLPRAGDDVCDWFTTYRRTAESLLQLIQDCKSRGRSAA